MALIIFYCCVLVIPNSALGHLEKKTKVHPCSDVISVAATSLLFA